MRTLFAVLLLSVSALAQGGAFPGSPVINGVGQPIANANVAVSFVNPCGVSPTYTNCNGQPQGIYGGAVPPPNAATLFTDITLGTGTANPIQTDPLGNWTVYATPGVYWATVYGYQIVPQVQIIVVGNGSGGGGGLAPNCAAALNGSLAAFSAPALLSCDPLAGTDFLGDLFGQSFQALGAKNGFVGLTGGLTNPILADANTFWWLAPDTVSSPYAIKPPPTQGTVGQVPVIASQAGNVNQWSWLTPSAVSGTGIRTCLVTIGDPGATSAALANDNDAPAQCGNDLGSDFTITDVACWADAGTPTVTPILTGGSGTSILSGALTCGTAAWAGGTLNGTPVLHTFSGTGATCASTPCTLDANITAAGGTAKYVVMKFTGTGPGGGGGGGGGSGTVTSVGLSLPGVFSVSGSPVTTSGTLAGAWSVAGADYLLTSTAANTAAFEQINGGASCGDGTHAVSYDVSTHKFGCQAISTGGTGTVTSAGLSVNGGSSSGIVAITGSPVTTTGTLNFNFAGTSGGISYFSSGSILSSSALLTAGNPVIGGGAGTAPSVGARSGNTTTFGTTSGALNSGDCAHFDASGNITDSGAACGTGSVTNIATVSPITGGPITNTGSIGCGTCLTGSGPTNHGVILGSGGQAVGVTATGASGQILTSNGSGSDPTFQTFAGSGSCIATPGFCATYANDTVTGTTNFVPAKWKSYSINEQKIKKTDSTDTLQGWFTNIVGIVQSGGGTSGSAVVAYAGRATCQFDNAATKGDFVTIGAAGLCTAVPGAGVNENPEINKYFAKVYTTIGSAGNTDVDLLPVGAYSLADCCGANGTAGRYQVGTSGSPFLSNGNLFIDSSSPGTAGTPLVGTTGGFTVYAHNNIAKGSKYTSEYGTVLNDGVTQLNGMALRLDSDTGMGPQFGYYAAVACIQGADCKNADGTTGNSAAFLTFPDISSVSATPSVIDTLADSHLWTMTGNWATFGVTSIKPGHVTRWTIKQDGTGGRTMVWPSSFINAPTVSVVPNDTTTAEFWAADSTHVYCTGGCTGPIRVVKTAQVAAITTTNIAKPQADSTYRVTATLDCDTTSAAATVNITIGWTDPSNTAQTATLGSAVVCTTLGTASVGSLTTAFRVKANTNITYATAIVNTPTYDAVVALETLTAN